jgi:hypothetical protein
MTYNSNLNDLVTDACAVSYRERLHHWAIALLLPNMERKIVARFRSRSDADGHLRFLRQHHHDAEYIVLFDNQQSVQG